MTTTSPPERFDLETLVLRRVRHDDAEDLFTAFATSAEATRFLTWAPKATVTEYAEFLAEAVPAWDDGSAFHWVLAPRATGRGAGMISAESGDHGVEIGYVLDPGLWGRGFMSAAAAAVVEWFAGQPDVHRVWATCDVDNVASARVLERAGMQHEGVLRRWMVHPNVSDVPRDSHAYSRVR